MPRPCAECAKRGYAQAISWAPIPSVFCPVWRHPIYARESCYYTSEQLADIYRAVKEYDAEWASALLRVIAWAAQVDANPDTVGPENAACIDIQRPEDTATVDFGAIAERVARGEGPA